MIWLLASVSMSLGSNDNFLLAGIPFLFDDGSSVDVGNANVSVVVLWHVKAPDYFIKIETQFLSILIFLWFLLAMITNNSVVFWNISEKAMPLLFVYKDIRRHGVAKLFWSPMGRCDYKLVSPSSSGEFNRSQ